MDDKNLTETLNKLGEALERHHALEPKMFEIISNFNAKIDKFTIDELSKTQLKIPVNVSAKVIAPLTAHRKQVERTLTAVLAAKPVPTSLQELYDSLDDSSSDQSSSES